MGEVQWVVPSCNVYFKLNFNIYHIYSVQKDLIFFFNTPRHSAGLPSSCLSSQLNTNYYINSLFHWVKKQNKKVWRCRDSIHYLSLHLEIHSVCNSHLCLDRDNNVHSSKECDLYSLRVTVPTPTLHLCIKNAECSNSDGIWANLGLH